MKLIINGTSQEVPGKPTLKSAVESLGYKTKFSAIAVNMKCIPRKDWEKWPLKEKDEIEVLSPQSGG